MRDGVKQVLPIAAGVLLVVGACIAFAMSVVHRGANEPRQTLARRNINEFLTGLERYKADTGTYPTNAQGLRALRERPDGVESWHGPYLAHELHNDPWGRPYVYRYPGEHGDQPDIASYATDGRPGGDGVDRDIVSWKGKP